MILDHYYVSKDMWSLTPEALGNNHPRLRITLIYVR